MNRICIPIVGPSLAEASEQVERAHEADLLELRLDKIRYSNPAELEPLLGRKRPVIFKGGKLDRELLALKPEYVDIEAEHLSNISLPAETQLIVSSHNHERTPDDLEGLFAEMRRSGADLYKIATYAHSAVDALRMLTLCKAHPGLLGICMGESGIATRVLGPLFGAPWTYASLDFSLQSAPGQLSLETLLNRYHFRTLTTQTKILGVMGGRVNDSPSIVRHNRTYKKLGVDAVYLPFQLSPEDLPIWFPLASELGLYGMSVTMPLKEVILTYIQDKGGVGAVNTLIDQNGYFEGYNYDGVGALDAIGDVAEKKVVILGAGGAAAAIAFEAKSRGGEVTILNRTVERAKELATRVGGKWGPLTSCPDADVVIQCTSVGMAPNEDQLPLPPGAIPAHALLLDIITHPSETLLLKQATCQTIAGHEMWRRQAARQLALWFDKSADAMLEVLL